MLSQFKIYWKLKCGHVHMRVFSGKRDHTLGKAGDLCMTTDEFTELKQLLTTRIASNFISFIEEIEDNGQD